VGSNTSRGKDLVARIYKKLSGARGMDDAERWQHALFFAMSPQERCRFSLKTARSALSLRRFAKKRGVIASKQAANREKDLAVLPILRRTLRLAKRLEKRRAQPGKRIKRRQKRRRRNRNQ